MQWAQVFCIALLVGILIAYSLNPAVSWLERLHLPRALAVSVVMLALLASLLLGSYALRGQVATLIERLPASLSRLSASMTLAQRDGQQSTLQRMQAASNEIQNATSSTPGKRAEQQIVVTQRPVEISSFLWAGSVSAAGLLGQAVMVGFLVFFLLLSGDTFKRKLVRLAGPTFAQRKITVQMLDEINASIQRYMMMLVTTNLLVMALSWLAFAWLGLDNAGAWAVLAGLLHIIPYLGTTVIAGATGLVAFLQFGSVSQASLIAGSSLVIALVVGLLITTWMTGRIARMNTAAVFIALLFFGWLWGIGGMLLSIPLIVIIKVVAEHIEQLSPIAELLSE
jgi:predicted PurR-regulated permease PerM